MLKNWFIFHIKFPPPPFQNASQDPAMNYPPRFQPYLKQSNLSTRNITKQTIINHEHNLQRYLPGHSWEKMAQYRVQKRKRWSNKILDWNYGDRPYPEIHACNGTAFGAVYHNEPLHLYWFHTVIGSNRALELVAVTVPML